MAVLLIDTAWVLGSGLAAYFLRYGDLLLPVHYQITLILGMLFAWIILPLSGVYRSPRATRLLHQVYAFALAWACIGLSLMLVAFITHTSATFSRLWLLLWLIGGFAVAVTIRMIATTALRSLRRRGWNHRRVVVVGTGYLGQQIAARLQQAPWLGLDICSFFEPTLGRSQTHIQGIAVRGGLEALKDYINTEAVDEVWIALPLAAEQQIANVLKSIQNSTIDIRFVLDPFGMHLRQPKMTVVAGLPVVDLAVLPMLR